MEQMKLISVLLWILLLLGFQEKLLAQSYFDERGKRILYPEYEEKILSGPYFGVPGKQPGEMRLVYRMPVGLTDARLFYEKLGKMDAYKAGQPLVVIFIQAKMNAIPLKTPRTQKHSKAISSQYLGLSKAWCCGTCIPVPSAPWLENMRGFRNGFLILKEYLANISFRSPIPAEVLS